MEEKNLEEAVFTEEPNEADLQEYENEPVEIMDENDYENLCACDSMNPVIQHLADMKIYKRLSAEEELEYAKRAFEGDESAIAMLICCNIRLAYSRAKVFFKKLKDGEGWTKKTIELADCLSWAEMGLVKGTRKFDYRKGFKFSTYVTYWIDSEIRNNFYANYSLISIPNNVRQLYGKINKLNNEWNDKYKRNITEQEAFEILRKDNPKLTIESVKRSMNSNNSVTSYEKFSNDGDDMFSLLDVYVPEGYVNNEDIDSKDKIDRVLDYLEKGGFDDITKCIVKRHLGLDEDSIQYTFDELGEQFNISKQAANGRYNKFVSQFQKKYNIKPAK